MTDANAGKGPPSAYNPLLRGALTAALIAQQALELWPQLFPSATPAVRCGEMFSRHGMQFYSLAPLHLDALTLPLDDFNEQYLESAVAALKLATGSTKLSPEEFILPSGVFDAAQRTRSGITLRACLAECKAKFPAEAAFSYDSNNFYDIERDEIGHARVFCALRLDVHSKLEQVQRKIK